MNTQQALWDSKHKEYCAEPWINQPSLFAQWVRPYLPLTGRILDLGAGQGQDSRYFAALGYQVVSTDFSAEALSQSGRKTPAELRDRITLHWLDLNEQILPFPDHYFSVVYAHLSLHYAPDHVLRQIFSEIERVLMHEGVIAALVNAVDDPEYRDSLLLSQGVMQTPSGITKRFFSVDSFRDYVQEFACVVLDAQGETEKDNARGVNGLIRFVGRRDRAL